MRGSRTFREGEGVLTSFLFIFYSHQLFSQTVISTDRLQEAIGPKAPSRSIWTQGGPNASRRRSITDFLRNPIANCNFQGGVGLGPLPPQDLPMQYFIPEMHLNLKTMTYM